MSDWQRKILESTFTLILATGVGCFAAGFLYGQHVERKAQADTWMTAYNAGVASARQMEDMVTQSMRMGQQAKISSQDGE